MASTFKIGPIGHLRAEPNEHILHFRKGRLARSGPGLSYWFTRLSASVAQVPVEDQETTFVLKERSSDFQEVSAQMTVVYRVAEPEKAVSRVNFTVDIAAGRWVEQPLERLAGIIGKRAQRPARSYITSVPVVAALRDGADAIAATVEEALRQDAELFEMGIVPVGVAVTRVAPTAEVEKALQTPQREKIQQQADEATYERRALAVEKERAIKQNELATEIELARRQEVLIDQEGANQLRQVAAEADAQRARTTAEGERQAILAEAAARDAQTRARGEAEARRLVATADADGEAARLAVWRDAPERVLVGLALREFAGKIDTIGHLNLTPDILTTALGRFLRDEAAG